MENKKNRKSILGRFSSIRTAILISFSTLLLASLFIFMFIALNYTRETVLQNSIDNTKKIINQVNYDIDSYFEYMDNISTMMAENDDIKSYLFDSDLSLQERQAKQWRILSQFKVVMKSRQDIYNIAAVSKNGVSIINDGQTKLNPSVDLFDQSWFKEALTDGEKSTISPSHVQNVIKSCYKWVITFSKALRNPHTNANEGLVFIDLNYKAISDLCNNNKIGKKGYVFILDESGNLIYHPQQQLMYGGLKSEIIDEIINCDKDYLLTDESNTAKLYTISKSKNTGWTVVGTSQISELLKNDEETQLLFLAVAVVLMFCVIALSSYVADSITRPMHELKNSMLKVENGDFLTASVAIEHKNEIGSLSKSFNVMTLRIEELMQQNIYEQEEKRKSELRALQSQINPHFLYNTLDSIIWMAEGKKNEEVVVMTASLAKLLRQSISNENEVVTLKQEIEYLRSYLTIQKMRYKDKLEFSISVDPKIQFIPIIKLVLQPIVENAIYHGLKYKNSKGMLSVIASEQGNHVIITIEDDGIGMDEETREHIFDEHKVNYHSNGVGVYNVQSRLQLYYGKDYGLHYESQKGVGTKVTITIPKNGGE